MKRRKLGSGAKRKLDSEDEDFIAKCIEDKGEAHGRRHDSIIYTGKRVKCQDLLTLANYHLAQRGKRLIRSANTVKCLGKPRNKRSIEAKHHKGKGLFCTRKPPKKANDDNENTHHQRSHVKLVKCDMFSKSSNLSENSLIISSDDKANLRPGTDVGVKGSRNKGILMPTEEEKARSLPQHDFYEPKVVITPSTFRFMTKKVQTFDDGQEELVRDMDQSVVTVRPKYYIGSSGSVWASDYIHIRHNYPQLFEKPEKRDDSIHWCLAVKKFCAQVEDYVNYFCDTTEECDVKKVKKSESCCHKSYEAKRLGSLTSGLELAKTLYLAEIDTIPEKEQQELLSVIGSVNMLEKCVQNCRQQLPGINGQTLFMLYEPLLKACEDTLASIAKLQLPGLREVVLELTDAGPGVGVSNYEVQFREAEKLRLLKSKRRTRVHRSRGDSAQNEAERTNAAIGEALVDGGPLEWHHYVPLENKSDEEIRKMTIDDVKAEEELCLQNNAWKVAENVCSRVHMEPGPANDLMLGLVTPKAQFFYNCNELTAFHKASKSKRCDLPGATYFLKVESFFNTHAEKGEVFLEVRACTECDFCAAIHSAQVHKSPRPFPDYSKLPEHHYLPSDRTPMRTADGKPRPVDDFLPRAQIKLLFNAKELKSMDVDKIERFCKTYIVSQDHVKAYIQHLEMLELKKCKRKEKTLRRTVTFQRPRSETEDDEPISDNDVPAVIHQTVNSDTEHDSDQTSEDDVVLAVVGESDHEESDGDSVVYHLPVSRTGRRYTTYRQRHFLGDSD
jgi:hypothetical protein